MIAFTNIFRNGMQTLLKKCNLFNDLQHRLLLESCQSGFGDRSANFLSVIHSIRKYSNTASSSSSSPTEYMDVKGKYALVMDGTRGVGFLFAEELLKMNAGKVIITGLDERIGAEAVRDLNERYCRPTRAYFYQTDVTNPSLDSHEFDFEDMFKYINNNFGVMQIFFNNAEMHGSKDVIGTHLETKLRGILLASKYMKNGVIVNHTSALGLDPDSQMIKLGAASAGIFAACMAFSKNKYFEKTKIRMMTLCSELSPMSVGDAEADRQHQISIAKSAVYVLKYGPKNTLWLCEKNGILSTVDLLTLSEFTEIYDSTQATMDQKP